MAAPVLPGATVSLCSAGVCRLWDLGGCLFCGCECCITACVSGRHVTVWCCMGDSRLCDMFCDFLGDSAVGCVHMCDWAVCCGVYSDALGTTRCVCMSMEVEGRSTELTLPALVLRSAWAGLWVSEPRVPSSTPLPAVPSGSRGRIQCLVFPTLFQHLWDRPIGQFKGLSICLAVPAPDTSHLPDPWVLQGAQDTRWQCPPLGTLAGALWPRGVLPVGVQYGGDTFVG